ncbi:MAG: enhanced serine sensitivity protein SseB C-terminal domain-containing protein [Solobacterium sp.]|nr:enhanced serine sensitivity protein SseB C-terminal domain-containing protein [Solobacterium sp.]
MAKGKKKKKVQNPASQQVKTAPVSNPVLKSAIEALKSGNSPEKQLALQNGLKKARLLAPVGFDVELKPGPDGRIANIKPNQIRFYLINTNDGKTFFPAFTDLEEAGKFKVSGDNDPKVQNIIRTVIDYDNMLKDANNNAEGIVINPGTDNIVIPKQLLGILSGRIKPVQQTAAPIQNLAAANATFSEPAIYPTRMVNAVYDHCAGVKEISRVWLKQKLMAGAVSFFLAVEADRNDQALLDGILETALPLAKDVPVEAAFVNDELMKKVIGEAVALYDRELEL